MNSQNNEKRDQIQAILGAVTDPRTAQPWRDGAGASDGPESLHISVRRSGRVHGVLELAQPPTEAEKQLGAAMEQALKQIEGVTSASLVLTAQTPQAGPSSGRTQAGGPASARQGRSPPERLHLESVRHIIVVASAKGGVGKSTLAVNLALAAVAKGLRVGLLDADIYGPSLPIMLGTQDDRPRSRRENDQTRIIPVPAHGLVSLSIGNLTDADTAMVWRGPMASSALMQLMGEVDWGDLDILFIDTPPGTGDVLLTLAQRAEIDGAVIVTTPQNVALADVRRGMALFDKTQIPVLGLVENMSWFEDAKGVRIPIFGGDEGSGTETAQALGTESLGRIPLHPAIGRGGDAGCPVMLEGGALAEVYAGIAEQVWTRLQALSASKAS